MKIKVTEEVTHDVHLDDEQMDAITIATLRKRFNIPEYAFIKGKKLMHSVEYHTSHSYDVDETHRNVEPLDKSILEIIEQIQEKKRDRDREVAETYFR